MYLKKQFLEKLKEKGVEISYKTLLRYENLSIVKRPNSGWRIYSESDIDEYVHAIQEYRKVTPHESEVNK